MTNPNIRAALEAAGEAVLASLTRPDVSCSAQQVEMCNEMPCFCAHDAAAAACIALLRAMPRNISLPTGEGALTANMSGFAMLANAIEREATP